MSQLGDDGETDDGTSHLQAGEPFELKIGKSKSRYEVGEAKGRERERGRVQVESRRTRRRSSSE